MSLNNIIESLKKDYGNVIIDMDSDKSDIPCCSTGIYSLNSALGGGIPYGKITEIYGSESSGKTTLALSILAQAQKTGKVAYIDAEHALNLKWAKTLGVNVNNVIFVQPDSGEQALDIVESLIDSGEISTIVVDSVSALTPLAEIEGEIGDANIGLQARMMSKAMRKFSAPLNTNKVALIFINQIRMKIGVLFGNPETTSGGRALKFFSSVRIDMRRISVIKDKTDTIGITVKARIVKSKLAAPFKESIFDIYFDSGISYIGDLLEIAVNKEVIEKSGAWYNYKEIRLGQGKSNAIKYLEENSQLLNEIKEKLY